MATIPESAIYKQDSNRSPDDRARQVPRLRFSVVATVSALAGGVAAAWYYRKTLARLQQAEAHPQGQEHGLLGRSDDSDDF